MQCYGGNDVLVVKDFNVKLHVKIPQTPVDQRLMKLCVQNMETRSIQHPSETLSDPPVMLDVILPVILDVILHLSCQ